MISVTRSWALTLAAATTLLAGCTAVVDGQVEGTTPAQSGSTSPTPSGTSASQGFPSGSPTPSTSSASSSAAAPSPYRRTRPSTAIGDAGTADLCKSLSLSKFGVRGWRASYDKVQFPPGCYVTLIRGKNTVSISAGAVSATTRTGAHKTVTLSGLTTYLYGYSKSTGSCSRSIRAQGLIISVSSYPGAGNVRTQSVTCGGTNAMTKQLAAAVAAHTVPRLALASPSVTSLDVCKVVRGFPLGKQPALAGLTLQDTEYGVGCFGTSKTVFFSVDVVISATAVPEFGKAVTVGGHRLYSSTGTSKIFCDLTSLQGRTSDGKYEQLSFDASARDVKKPPGGLCTQTGLAAAAYLDTAGLK